MATPKTSVIVAGFVALVLATVAGYMIYNYLQTKEREAKEAKLEVQPIVVANTDIPIGSRLRADQLKASDWPKSSLPVGFITDAKSAEGRLAISDIRAGSPVLTSSLASEGAEGGVLSMMIKPGYRAITVAVNEVVGVAGFVLPSSIVDVVAVLNTPYARGGDTRVSKIILQNVKVLAVGQILEEKEGKPVVVPTVTVEVMPEDAEKLALAAESKVQLILKKLGDTSQVSTRGVTTASLLGGAAPAAPAGARPAKAPAKKAAAPAAKTEKPAEKPSGMMIEVIRGSVKSQETYQ